MEMIPVDSEYLSAVGYENGIMLIMFNNGGLFQYNNVPDFIHRGLMNASSKGTYFHEFIKLQYPATRIG